SGRDGFESLKPPRHINILTEATRDASSNSDNHGTSTALNATMSLETLITT
ncbi:MAG: hypothetical protein JWM11_7125, partial [Planctomycetaceae bacterium]|nr:hypothetical protein [Planctomycetaceae bacterium]